MNTLQILSYIGALSLSAVGGYFSILGLTSIFAGAFWPVVIMGGVMEIAKIIATSWLYQNWKNTSSFLKWYLAGSVAVLCLITSLGIFGFLSKAHSERSLVSGDALAKLAVYDEKIKTAKENINGYRQAIKQMDEAVDQVMARSSDEKGAEKAIALRRSQQKERARVQAEIQADQNVISQLNEERAPIAAEVRKVEAEVGPIKYIAGFIYGQTDQVLLEKAVTWMIIILVIVFDPLALALLLAANSQKKNVPKLKRFTKRNTIELGRDAIMNMQLEKT